MYRTDSVCDDVTQQALLRHEPGPLAAVLEVRRLQGLQEMSTQKLEADVRLFFFV